MCGGHLHTPTTNSRDCPLCSVCDRKHDFVRCLTPKSLSRWLRYCIWDLGGPSVCMVRCQLSVCFDVKIPWIERANAHTHSETPVAFRRSGHQVRGAFAMPFAQDTGLTRLFTRDQLWLAVTLEVGKNRRPLSHGELSCPWRSRQRFSSSVRRRAVSGPCTVRISRRAPTW